MRSGGFCGGRVPGYGAGLSSRGPVKVVDIDLDLKRAQDAFDRLKEKEQCAVKLRYGDDLVEWFRRFIRDPYGRVITPEKEKKG